MLQCVAMCCNVLQCVAVWCSVLQCVAVCCSVLQCVAMWPTYTSHNREANTTHIISVHECASSPTVTHTDTGGGAVDDSRGTGGDGEEGEGGFGCTYLHDGVGLLQSTHSSRSTSRCASRATTRAALSTLPSRAGSRVYRTYVDHVYTYVFVYLCICVFMYLYHIYPYLCHIYDSRRRLRKQGLGHLACFQSYMYVFVSYFRVFLLYVSVFVSYTCVPVDAAVASSV